jgi:hypothetical protein
LNLGDKFNSEGKITLEDARIEGVLRLERATLGVALENAKTAKGSKPATQAEKDLAKILADIQDVAQKDLDTLMEELEEPSVAEQRIQDTTDRTILAAARLRLSGSPLAQGLTAHGKIDLISGGIGGLLNLRGAPSRQPRQDDAARGATALAVARPCRRWKCRRNMRRSRAGSSWRRAT